MSTGENIPDQSKLDIVIDGESYAPPARRLTADEVLALAGLSAADHYLVRVDGKHQESYQNRGSEVLQLHEKEKFVSVFIGPTTVSDETPTGAALFSKQLRALGFDVRAIDEQHVVFPYIVEVGSRVGQQFTLGFRVPSDFPFTPPTGPHVSPHIHPIHPGGLHPTGGVHPSRDHGNFGDDFQYWSRPFPNWAGSRKTASEYMSFIRTLWATQ